MRLCFEANNINDIGEVTRPYILVGLCNFQIACAVFLQQLVMITVTPSGSVIGPLSENRFQKVPPIVPSSECGLSRAGSRSLI